MTNLPPFYIGQRVVQLVDGMHTPTKKGDIHIVLGLFQLKCGCWTIDIGFIADLPKTYCDICLVPDNINHGIKWVRTEFFAPITENFQSISLEKVLETETPLISVN